MGGAPLAQMCDSPVDPDGIWERCLTYYPNGVRNPAKTDCYTMRAGQPPPGDPILGTPPTHIDPWKAYVEGVLEGAAGTNVSYPTKFGRTASESAAHRARSGHAS